MENVVLELLEHCIFYETIKKVINFNLWPS